MKNPLKYGFVYPRGKTWLSQLRRISRNRFPYEPLITVELSRVRLLHNLAQFRAVAPKSQDFPHGAIAPVLKSNAYGHGLFEIAEILEKDENKKNKNDKNKHADKASRIPFFVVDSYFEAIALRARGIKTPLLIIGYTRPETIMNSRLKNIAFTITSLETLREISDIKIKNPVTIHLKIDTGMNRQGIQPNEISEAIAILQKSQQKKKPHLILEGITSHFSDADNADTAFTKKQIALWNSIVTQFKNVKYIHTSATDGHRFTEKISANVSRLGLGLYGLSDNLDFAKKMSLEPVLQMKTIITGIKKVKTDETVGYGNTFIVPQNTARGMTIATIPVGYFEGLNRKLSNNGVVLVETLEKKEPVTCPIIGRVSMNITTIEIPEVSSAKEKSEIKIGSSVIAISNSTIDQNSITSIAKKCGTITYEIAVHIPAHLKRIAI